MGAGAREGNGGLIAMEANDAVARLEQRVAALLAELQRQREQSQQLIADNEALRGRIGEARRRLDAVIDAAAETEV